MKYKVRSTRLPVEEGAEVEVVDLPEGVNIDALVSGGHLQPIKPTRKQNTPEEEN